MDSAYDHIQESTLSPDATAARRDDGTNSTLNGDFQEAYKAISSSPWGSRLGGFFGSVVKQGGHVYKEASQELSAVGQEATKGLTDLRSSIVSRTRSLSVAQGSAAANEGEAADGSAEGVKSGEGVEGADKTLQESEGVLARLRSEAAKRLKEIEKAEDAADVALLKFGTNIRNFLRDAVTVAPSGEAGQGDTVVFESKDAQGKRVIHSTRFDAQLHVIHSGVDSFTQDPASDEYAPWQSGFDVESKTADVSRDLEKYPELRSAMEKVVPDQVAYKDFWTRYYFLRHSIETAEARRRDLLKGAATAEAEEEIGWDEDSEDEDTAKPAAAAKDKTSSVASSQTINPAPAVTLNEAHLQPLDATVRKKSADDRSQADSEASYDVVGARSGISSQAPGSPRPAADAKKGDDSDEEDWE